MALAWPSVLKPVSASFTLQNASRSGGVALNGFEQIVDSGAERWRARLVVPIRTTEEVLAIRTYLGTLAGRSGEANVPVFDGKRANWPVDAQGRVLHPGFTRRKRLDGTPYEDPEIPTQSAINAEVNTDAALRAVEVGILKSQGSEIIPGQYFGLADRLYLVREIVAITGAITRVGISPPLRAAANAGEVITFTRPTCTMRLLSDENEVMLELMQFASMTLEFVESV